MRQCADVGKLSYHMRANGDPIYPHLLSSFDKDLRTSIETILGGSMLDSSWWQAAFGVKHGGLGLRQAADVALPALVASRVASRLQVATMATHRQQAGLAHVSSINACV